MKKIKRNKKGQVILVSLIIFAVLMIFSAALMKYILNTLKAEKQAIASMQALHLAEAGIDKAAYELNQNSSYSGETDTAIGDGSFTVSVSTIDSEHRRITSVGSVPYSGGHTATKTIKATLGIDDTVISFHYGVQAGNGGFTLDNSSTITGNVFSTGTIAGSSENDIYGDVVSAGSSGWIYGVHVAGNAFSHTIGKTGSSYKTYIDEDAYYASSITNTTVSGTQHSGSADQATVDLPISDDQISEWEDDAASGGTISSCDGDGNYEVESDTSLGWRKITCNLIIKNITLTIDGPLWVTGDITIRTGAHVKMDSSLGSSNVAVIADNQSDRANSGKIIVEQSSTFEGSGSAGSFVFLISQNNSAESGGSAEAISMNQGAAALVTYAAHGMAVMNQSANVKEVTAYKISLKNTANVTYESGLPSTLFESGPGGSWIFSPGSYTIY